ncbi:unnamed protein product [Rotaria sordida]|uniref:TTF-type domain-containing protein n=2 Tax=Rotaria sordida TaxID=392033 RepID=A0A815ICJ0_9BILA|nr:unnamed protein product [Rotaria sordida]
MHILLLLPNANDPFDSSVTVCTLRNFPNLIEHTIEWVRDNFAGLFTIPPQRVEEFLRGPKEFVERTTKNHSEYDKTEISENIKRILGEEGQKKISLIVLNGDRFWSENKRCPHVLKFDVNNELHLDFIVAASNLLAHMYYIPQIRNRKLIGKEVVKIHVPEFKPKVGITIHENDEQLRADLKRKRIRKQRTESPSSASPVPTLSITIDTSISTSSTPITNSSLPSSSFIITLSSPTSSSNQCLHSTVEKKDERCQSTTPTLPASIALSTSTVSPTSIALPTLTALPTSIASPTLTALPTSIASPTLTALPTSMVSPTSTALPTSMVSPTSIASPTVTALPTSIASPTLTALPTSIALLTSIASPTSTALPTSIASPTLTALPTSIALPTSTALPTLTILPTDTSRSKNEPPSQPILSSYKRTNRKRSFQSQWFQGRPWLEYSVIEDKAYCYYCRHFGSSQSTSRNQSNSFLNGFCNWKKALDMKAGFKQHESSEAHVQAAVNYQQYLLRYNTQTSVINILDTGRSQQIKRNRDRISKIASTVLLCSRQMIALRGHCEDETSDNRGNLLEILSWSSQTDPIVQSIVNSANNATYLSPQVQNELLQIMANQIRRKIADKIAGNFYSLMADESRDISGNAQLSIVVRVVSSPTDALSNKNNIIQEYFLGFVRLHQFDAMTLSSAIVRFLNLYQIDLKACIGIASVMGGCNAGVQTILRDNFMPKGIYIHCFVHKLNLVIIDVCQVVSYCTEFYSIISKIHSYFTASGVTNEYFKNAQQLLQLDTTTKLKKWSYIRWDSRWTSINAIINNYQAILKALNDLLDDGDTRSVDANGLLIAIKEPLFIVTLFIMHKIFGPIKILSNQLQDESLDFGKAKQLISSIIEQMKSYRDENLFQSLYCKVVQFCEENGIDISQKPRQRRQKKVPARFNDSIVTSTTGHRYYADNEQQYCTTLYFPLIDSVLIELNHRFSRETMEVLTSISSLCPKNEKFLDFEILKPFALHLDINPDGLQNELNVLRPMLKNKELFDIKELYCELIQFTQAFPNAILIVQATNNCAHVFLNATQLTIKHYFKTSGHSIRKTLNGIFSLKQVTKLVIQYYHFLFEQIVKSLRCTSDLNT